MAFSFSFAQNGFGAHFGSPDITTVIEAPEGWASKWLTNGARHYLALSRDGAWPAVAAGVDVGDTPYIFPLWEMEARSRPFDSREPIWLAIQSSPGGGEGTWFFLRLEEESAYRTYVYRDQGIRITRNGKDTSAAENLLAAMVMGGGE